MNFLNIVLPLLILGSVYAVEEDDVTVQFTVDTFKENVLNRNHFVMFYAPWCGHCQRLSPTWTQLAEMLNLDGDSKVTIAKVDCTTEKEICSENDVTGYPTLIFFKVGESEGVKFRGIRDLPTLTNFINEQLGNVPEDSNEMPAIPNVVNGLVELTEDTFAKHIAQGKHFVEFYAPWCGHCQKLATTWEQLASSLLHNRGVSISKIDCTLYRGMCTQFEVKGYPTLLWIEDGKKIEKYTGQRTHEDLKLYVEKMSSTASRDDDGEDAPKEKSEDEISNNVAILTSDNFEHGIESGFVFVKFFAPWCGHCKRLAPTWEDLGRKFAGDTRVVIAKVDCSIQNNKNLCTEENVDGFPSLFLFRDGVKISEYDGSRTLEDLHNFVIEQIGSSHDEL